MKIGHRLRGALGAAGIVGLALIGTATPAAPARAATLTTVAPAPVVLSGVQWGANDRVTWTMTVPAGTVVIVAIDYLERRQVLGPVPNSGQLVLSIDASGAPAEQITLAVWRVPGAEQGSLSLILRRPAGAAAVTRPSAARPGPIGRFPNG